MFLAFLPCFDEKLTAETGSFIINRTLTTLTFSSFFSYLPIVFLSIILNDLVAFKEDKNIDVEAYQVRCMTAAGNFSNRLLPFKFALKTNCTDGSRTGPPGWASNV